MRFLLIGCEVILRELCDGIARSPHLVDPTFLPKGLHDRGPRAMRRAIQEKIDASVNGGYDAVILGYGLCGNGLAGLAARDVPLVLPRAHDCLALLMGSQREYEDRFRGNPGVYYRSIGWIERGQGIEPLAPSDGVQDSSLEGLIAKYGEENGRYLYQQLTAYQKAYSRLGYIATGLEYDDRFAGLARAEAETRGWAYDSVPGSLDLFRRLLAGDWDDADFLIVPPGSMVKPCHDGRVVLADPRPDDASGQP